MLVAAGVVALVDRAHALAIELEAADQYQDAIATQLVEAKTFWKAEEYHQQYLHKRNLNVCH